MKLLHVFTNMNYVYNEAFIKLFYKYIPEFEQDIFINDSSNNIPNHIKNIIKDNGKLFSLGNSGNIRKLTGVIKRLIDNYDYVIFHFLPNDPLLHIFLRLHKHYLKKIVWRIWGADLYNWRRNINVLNALRYYTRAHIPYVLIQDVDKEEYIKQFGKGNTLLECVDARGYDEDVLLRNQVKKSGAACNILIGHSAVKTINHIYVLNALKKFSKNDIRLIIPLNYGDTEYKQEVKAKAYELFDKTKVVFIEKKIPLEDYIKILWRVDIAIFHSDRQIAEGNIIMLMFMGKKIFIKSNSVLDEYYRQKNHLTIFDSSKIGSMSFKDFKNSDFDNSRNREFALNDMDMTRIANEWRSCFEYLEKQL